MVSQTLFRFSNAFEYQKPLAGKQPDHGGGRTSADSTAGAVATSLRSVHRTAQTPMDEYCTWIREADSSRKWLFPSCEEGLDSVNPQIVIFDWRHCPYCGKLIQLEASDPLFPSEDDPTPHSALEGQS